METTASTAARRHCRVRLGVTPLRFTSTSSHATRRYAQRVYTRTVAWAHETHVSLRNSVDTSSYYNSRSSRTYSPSGILPWTAPASQPADELGSHLVAQPSSKPPAAAIPGAASYRSVGTRCGPGNENESLFFHGPPFSIPCPRSCADTFPRGTKHGGSARVYSGRHRKSRLSKSLGVFFATPPPPLL